MNRDQTVPSPQPRKTRDRALVLVLSGLLLLMPPLAHVSQAEARIGGLPLALVYLFVVWAALIVGARLLARPLAAQSRTDEKP